jgi:hypothetical protein
VPRMDTVGAWLIHRLTQAQRCDLDRRLQLHGLAHPAGRRGRSAGQDAAGPDAAFLPRAGAGGRRDFGALQDTGRPARLLRRRADLDRPCDPSSRAVSASTPSRSSSRWSASTRSASSG